ncbi:adenylyl-sulfate kinase [Gammaproteobacteria bacterium 45_16_T64]|mgnify:CR=1 FL=1|nr:adenylyl-sulfate kinase [Gammaproteobacteria bacterium 45_16_T64]
MTLVENNLTWHEQRISKAQRAELKNQRPFLLWLTGLSGAGKSTIANELECEMYRGGHHSYILDGDNVRQHLNGDLGFSNGDRVENIRRIAEVSKLFVDSGMIIIAAFISPFRAERELAKRLLEEGEFVEVYVKASLDICEKRDSKGLYKKARLGEIKNFTGIDSPYEEPVSPDIVIDNALNSVEDNVQIILAYLRGQGLIN